VKLGQLVRPLGIGERPASSLRRERRTRVRARQGLEPHSGWPTDQVDVLFNGERDALERRQITAPATVCRLVADGLHARTDGFTSLAVLLGAGGVAIGWQWADPLVGLLITVAILGVLRLAVPQVGAPLMDAVDPALVDQATQALVTVEGVKEVRELRIRRIGHRLRAEADITADASLTITQAHELAQRAEDRLLARIRRLNAANVHVSPVGAHAHPD